MRSLVQGLIETRLTIRNRQRRSDHDFDFKMRLQTRRPVLASQVNSLASRRSPRTTNSFQAGLVYGPSVAAKLSLTSKKGGFDGHSSIGSSRFAGSNGY